MTAKSRNPFRRKLETIADKLSFEHFAEGDTNESPIVYHYTDPTGLLGILSDGQLWATDIHYLNDSSELLHAERMHRQVIDEIDLQFPEGAPERRLAKEARERRSALKEMVDTYVVCFSARDDMWTQWSTYGSRGAGFSIGFDRRKLEATIQAPWHAVDFTNLLKAAILPKAHLAKVQYSEEDQKRALRRAFTLYSSLVSTRSSQERVASCARALVDNVAHTASLYKHPCFEPEAEWRVVITALGGNSDLCFRASRRTVVPFLKTVRPEDGKLPVVSITIGPTLQQELSKRSVQALLDARRYFREVGIRVSHLPIATMD